VRFAEAVAQYARPHSVGFILVVHASNHFMYASLDWSKHLRNSVCCVLEKCGFMGLVGSQPAPVIASSPYFFCG